MQEEQPIITAIPTCNRGCQFLKDPTVPLGERECSEYGTPPIWVARGIHECPKYKRGENNG